MEEKVIGDLLITFKILPSGLNSKYYILKKKKKIQSYFSSNYFC